MIGYWILRSQSGRQRSRSSSSKKGGGGQLAILGLAFMAIGWIGVFFGRLIKSAVSRQREFLGDAAAVQFTRNPSSIAGALKKIGGLAAGSRITNPHAEEASHLFFGNGMGKGIPALDDMLATHPPLVERIKRIEPGFDGKMPAVDPGVVSQAQEQAAKEEEAGGFVPAFAPAPPRRARRPLARAGHAARRWTSSPPGSRTPWGPWTRPTSPTPRRSWPAFRRRCATRRTSRRGPARSSSASSWTAIAPCAAASSTS